MHVNKPQIRCDTWVCQTELQDSGADTLSWLEHEYDLIPDDKEEIESKVSGIDNANSVHSGDFSQQASPGSPHTFEQVKLN